MGRRQRLVDLTRLLRSGLGPCPCFLGRHEPVGVVSQNAVRIGQTCIGRSVARVQVYSFLKVVDAFPEAVRSSLVPLIPASEVKLVRFGILCGALGETLPLGPV